MNLCWYLVVVWVGLLLLAPEEALWMAAALVLIVAAACALDALMHRNDRRNLP